MITPEKGIYKMLEVADIVRKEIRDYKLVFIGGFVRGRTRVRRDFTRRIADLGLEDHVEILGWVPYCQVPHYINLGKLGLSLLEPWCYSYLVTEAYKTLEIMACGKPVIATRENIPARLVVEQSGGGVLVDGSDTNGIADHMIRLLRNDHEAQELGSKARRFIESHRKRRDFEKKLLSLYPRASKWSANT